MIPPTSRKIDLSICTSSLLGLKFNWKEFRGNLEPDGHLVLVHRRTKKEEAIIPIVNCTFYDAVGKTRCACSILVILSTNFSNVKRKWKRFYVKTDSLVHIDTFKTFLEDFGGIHLGNVAVKHGSLSDIMRIKSSLTGLAVSQWTNVHVRKWLEEINMASLKRFFSEENHTGNYLCDLDLSLLKSHFGRDSVKESEVSELYGHLQEVKYTGYFVKNSREVGNKFRRIFSDEQEVEAPYLHRVIDSLCDSVKLKHTYFTTAESFFYLRENVIKQKVSERAFEQHKRKYTRVMNAPSLILPSDREEVLQKYNAKNIRVKLVVTEAPQMKKSGLKLKQIFSPILHAVKPPPSEMFNFSLALIVGPWYLEWNESGVIVPKRLTYNAHAIISVDVDSIAVHRDKYNNLTDRMAELISHWNCNMKYSTKGGGKNSKNSAEFCDAVLDVLNINPDKLESISTYLEGCRKNGKNQIEFESGEEFEKMFGVRRKRFDSHLELDLFVIELKSKCHELEEKFLSEYALLKAFDRAFWLRYINTTKDHPDFDKYKPADPKPDEVGLPKASGCPFRDPRKTRSYLV